LPWPVWGRMLDVMAVLRIVPNLSSESIADSVDFYREVFGLDVVMDHGWIATVADPTRSLQLSVMTHEETAAVVPDVSLEVDDVDAAHAVAVERGAEIVHPLTDEPWGVRRFFLRDPDGHVINVLAHP